MRAANFIFGKIFSLRLLCCENFLIGYNFSMQVCAISPSAHKIFTNSYICRSLFLHKRMFGTEFFQSIFLIPASRPTLFHKKIPVFLIFPIAYHYKSKKMRPFLHTTLINKKTICLALF